MAERFVSQRLLPITDQVVAGTFAIGAPLLPTQFRWDSKLLVVREVMETWKETGPCRHGSGERYVRKHWFRVRLESGEELKLYFERQPRFRGGPVKARWWLFSISSKPSSCERG